MRIAPGAAALLIVGIQRNGRVVMIDEADIRLVNPHIQKSDSGLIGVWPGATGPVPIRPIRSRRQHRGGKTEPAPTEGKGPATRRRWLTGTRDRRNAKPLSRVPRRRRIGSRRRDNEPRADDLGAPSGYFGLCAFRRECVEVACGLLGYLRHNGLEHVLAFAPTRSGKGVGLGIPTLLAWSESAVIYDIKGENWAKTAGFRSQQGHLCFKFSPVEDSASSRFNPLEEVRLFTPRDVSDAQNIADMIIRSGEDSPMERHWEDSAASLTTGMILHACYSAAAEGRIASLADLAGLFTRPGVQFRETLNEMLSYPHDPEHKYGWRTPLALKTSTHPVVSEKAQEMLDKENKELSGVLSTAKTALTLYSDPLIARNTAASDFTINDLVNHIKPVSLYLVVPPSDKIRLRRLIRLMFTMVVNRLTERMAFEGSEQKRNAHRLLFLIDEFPSLNRMEIFADALSYMAGYGLKAYLITQDIRQIVDAYGQNESIVSNCHVRIAFAPNQVETAELLSKMTGTATVQKASFNFSGSRFSPVMSHVNASVDHVERPLMTPDEIMRLRPPRKEGEGDTERIVEPGDMLIFTSGHYPILGMQMLYFSGHLSRCLVTRSRRHDRPGLARFLGISCEGRPPLPPPDRLRGLDQPFRRSLGHCAIAQSHATDVPEPRRSRRQRGRPGGIRCRRPNHQAESERPADD